MIATSFPEFMGLMSGLGASIDRSDGAERVTAMIIAIDGPAGAGKGTLARRLADHYRLNHLDTGLTYRAVAHALLQHGAAARRCLGGRDRGAPGRPGRSSTAAVLSAHAVGEAASKVAVIPGRAAHPGRKAARLRQDAAGRGARRTRHRHGRLPRRRREALCHGQRRGARAAPAGARSRAAAAPPISTRSSPTSCGATSATSAAPTRR